MGSACSICWTDWHSSKHCNSLQINRSKGCIMSHFLNKTWRYNKTMPVLIHKGTCQLNGSLKNVFKLLTLKDFEWFVQIWEIFFLCMCAFHGKKKRSISIKHKNTFNTFKILSENKNITVKRNEVLHILSNLFENKGV